MTANRPASLVVGTGTAGVEIGGRLHGHVHPHQPLSPSHRALPSCCPSLSLRHHSALEKSLSLLESLPRCRRPQRCFCPTAHCRGSVLGSRPGRKGKEKMGS